MKDPLDRMSRQIPLDIVVVSGLPILLVVGLLSILAAVPNRVAFPMAIMMAGVAIAGGVIMTIAKWPLYRRGRLLAIGCGELDPPARKVYWRGLAVAVVGIAGEAVFLLALIGP